MFKLPPVRSGSQQGVTSLSILVGIGVWEYDLSPPSQVQRVVRAFLKRLEYTMPMKGSPFPKEDKSFFHAFCIKQEM